MFDVHIATITHAFRLRAQYDAAARKAKAKQDEVTRKIEQGQMPDHRELIEVGNLTGIAVGLSQALDSLREALEEDKNV